MSLTNDQIRAVFLAHGYTIKPGQTDLKPYVYDAAHALLLAIRAQPAPDEPAAGQWRMVPVEPTQAMIDAGYQGRMDWPEKPVRTEVAVYRAMLAAAPHPPARGAQAEEVAHHHGLTEGERDQAVADICAYGTGFVAPLYAVVEGIERKVAERYRLASQQAAGQAAEHAADCLEGMLEDDEGAKHPCTCRATPQPQRGAGEGLVPLESLLSEDEATFVRAVFASPGSKGVGQEWSSTWKDDGTEYGCVIHHWERLEKLGLIRCVGGFKWEPTDRLAIGIRPAGSEGDGNG